MKTKSQKPAHVIAPSKLAPPPRLAVMACRAMLRDLEGIIHTQGRKIHDTTPHSYNESRNRLSKLCRDAVIVFLRTHKLPRGWHFRDADTLPSRPDLDDVFVASQQVRDDVDEVIARDRRVADEAMHALYLDAAAAKNKLLVYADPGVVADLDKLRSHDYLAEARRKLGVKELEAK